MFQRSLLLLYFTFLVYSIRGEYKVPYVHNTGKTRLLNPI